MVLAPQRVLILFAARHSVNRSDGWTDPLIGARYHRDLGNGFGLTAYGDIGGFGIGAHVDSAGPRHDRLCLEPLVRPASRVSQPELHLQCERPKSGLRCPY